MNVMKKVQFVLCMNLLKQTLLIYAQKFQQEKQSVARLDILFIEGESELYLYLNFIVCDKSIS